MNRAVSERDLNGAQLPEGKTGKKVCVITGELEGPFYNGGVGTQNRALAIVLRQLGYEVDILYTQVNRGTPFCLRGNFSDHVAAFQHLGIRLLCIDNDEESNNWHARSFLSLQHLLHHRYDLVFFDDMLGTAYYPLLARRTHAPALRGTKMSVTLHGSVEWASELNEAPVTHFDGLPLMEMERRSIELADSARAGSDYIFRKYQTYGWKLPDNIVVLPNFVSGARIAAQPVKKVEVKELVFFGRLETRKGLWIFCRALDRLKYVLAGYRVAFLGKMTPETGDLLIKRTAAWPFPVRFLNNFNREQAIAYLKRDGRLAVMPSTEDNNPSVILECLEEGIPFIASSGSGGEELIDKESQAHNLFDPSVDGLCAKILETLADGGMTARASFDPPKLRADFAKWVEGFINSPAPRSPKQKEQARAAAREPVLLVVVPPEFRPHQAAAELRNAREAFGGRAQIEALTAEPELLREQLDGMSDVNVRAYRDFPALAKSFAKRPSTTVGLCHITQILPRKWAERAENCFAEDENIGALTGMVAAERESDTSPREPFFSTLRKQWKFDRYLTGFSPPLFSLRQDTNSGFAWIRSDLLPLVSNVLPADAQYDRPRSMENWIHEILVTLHIAGKRFELVPDQLVDQPRQETPFEALRSADFMRSLATRLHGYAAGTDQWLLTRIAIDAGLERERARHNTAYLKAVSTALASNIVPVSAYAPRELSYPQLAQIAHATGQIDIAVDLLAALVVPEKGSDSTNITKHVEFSARAVRLSDFLAANLHTPLNLNHPWSFKAHAKEFELHPNSAGEGKAALSFALINLKRSTRFFCSLRLPAREARPVRVRVDVIPPDHAHYYAAEKILQSGDNCQWEFGIPETVRTTCTVLFSVEMANPNDAAENCYTMVADARFE